MLGYENVVGNRILLNAILCLQNNLPDGRVTSTLVSSECLRGHKAHSGILCFLPSRLNHARIYANHHGYNALLAFLEECELGWTSDSAKTDGKRFVEGMSKAFFQCNPSTWKARNDRHNNDALISPCDCVIWLCFEFEFGFESVLVHLIKSYS